MIGHQHRTRSMAAAALLSALLAGCANFSPDGGMTVVAGVTGETISKDVVAIRNAEDADRAGGAVHPDARPPAVRTTSGTAMFSRFRQTSRAAEPTAAKRAPICASMMDIPDRDEP